MWKPKFMRKRVDNKIIVSKPQKIIQRATPYPHYELHYPDKVVFAKLNRGGEFVVIKESKVYDCTGA